MLADRFRFASIFGAFAAGLLSAALFPAAALRLMTPAPAAREPARS